MGDFKKFKKLHSNGVLLEGDRSLRDRLSSDYGITKFIGSTGFSEKDQKWYGWSHRAIYGFKIGDKIFEADYGDDKTKFNVHGTKECRNLDDCYKAAKAFSDYVS